MTDSQGNGGRWRDITGSRNWVAIGAVAVVVVVVVVGLLGLGPKPTAITSQTPPPLPTAGPSPGSSSSSSPPSSSPTVPGADPLLGLDGRFTILLLGSDFRGSSPGNRTDTIMIVSVVPDDGAVSVVSIPRDTAQFPLPSGKVWEPKINGLYPSRIRRFGRDGAGTEVGRLIGGTLGVEIDAYALIGMVGLTTLIDELGGVDVVLDAPVRDRFYWTNEGTQGIFFPAGKNHLNGERALIFARTRKGDSDFQRVRRQQQLVQATVEKVLKKGAGALPSLLQMVQKWVITDVQIDQALAIFELVAQADLDHVHSDVLGPRYADPIPGTVDYKLRLDKVRALIARWFAPVPGSPAASVAPSQAP